MRARLAIALLAAAALLQELLLTRIFSATLYYHYAFLAVSVALLGVAAGGALVQATRRRLEAVAPEALVSGLSLVAAVAFPLSLGLALTVPFKPGATPEGIAWVVLVYPSLALPFVLAGGAIAIGLSRLPSPGAVYAADLLGSAFGCLAFVPLVAALDGPPAGFAVGAAAAAAGLVAGGRRLAATGAALAVALAALAVTNDRTELLVVRHRLGRPVGKAAFERWNALAQVRVDPIQPRSRPFGWGLSQRYRAEKPIAQARVEIDSGALTVMTGFSGDTAEVAHLGYDITNLAHHLRPRARTLVLGVGAGRDVLSAIAFEAPAVTGVEVNELVLDLLTRQYGDFAGHLERRPGVRLVHDEARSWLARDRDSWDLVQMSLVDTAAATGAGAYALVEDGLYTVEGVRLMLRRLAPNGLVTVSRWWYGGAEDAPAQVARLAALFARALRDEGAKEPERHVLLARTPPEGRDPESGDAVVTLVASREPLSAEDVSKAEAVCRRLGFALVQAPGRSELPIVARLLREPDVGGVAGEVPFEVRPSTDDWPFFFHGVRLGDVLLGRARPGTHAGQSSFNLEAVEVLLVLLGAACAFTLLFVFVPLIPFARGATPVDRRMLAYVAAIGLGYMLVELALAQRLVLYLGHPSYAFTVVLFTLVGSSGTGSLLARRFERLARAVILVLVAVLGVLALVMPPLIEASEGWSTPLRVSVAAGLLAPAGLLMGMPLPLGIARARARGDEWTPWYWAVNGAASVAGSVVAVAFSLTFGIAATILAGAVAYALAALAVGGRRVNPVGG